MISVDNNKKTSCKSRSVWFWYISKYEKYWLSKERIICEIKKLMISVQNHQKLDVSDHQFDFGTSPSMRSTDWVREYLQGTWLTLERLWGGGVLEIPWLPQFYPNETNGNKFSKCFLSGWYQWLFRGESTRWEWLFYRILTFLPPAHFKL